MKKLSFLQSLIFIFAVFNPQASFAVGTPLNFPAEQNNFQLLPQQFEYELIDSNKVKVGDLTIDAAKLRFKIQNISSKKVKLLFFWPSSFVRTGQLLIKNNNGKAIFNTPIDISDKSEKQSRNGYSQYEVEVSSAFYEELKALPFLSFCVFRSDIKTRINLCSIEFYFAKQDNKITILPRENPPQEAQIKINQQVVGNQGIVYLNNPNENLIFKAITTSGVTIEIETRYKQIDIPDVFTDENKKNIHATLAGTEPTTKTNATLLANNNWQIHFPLTKPSLYFLGDGDIPLHQDFFAKQELPNPSDRIYFDEEVSEKTYSSQINQNIIIPANTSINSFDNNSTVEKSEDNKYRWSINNLTENTLNRRVLLANKNGKKYATGFDFYKGNPFEFGATAVYSSSPSLIYGHLSATWWVEKPFFLNTSLLKMKLGVSASLDQHLTNSSTSPVDYTQLDILYRFTPGFHFTDDTYGLILPYLQAKTDAGTSAAYGLGVFTSRKASSQLTKYFKWYKLSLKYLTGSSADVQISSAYQIEAFLLRDLKDKLLLNYGFKIQQIKYSPSAAKEDIQFNPYIGFYFM